MERQLAAGRALLVIWTIGFLVVLVVLLATGGIGDDWWLLALPALAFVATLAFMRRLS